MDLHHALFILAGAEATEPYRLLVSSKLLAQAQRRLQDELVTRSEARAARTEFMKRLGFPYSL